MGRGEPSVPGERTDIAFCRGRGLGGWPRFGVSPNAVDRRRVIVIAREVGMIHVDNYRNRLAATKELYPFRNWAKWGIELHTKQALNLFVTVFDQLIERLTTLGQQAPESEKIAAIREAVETLNALNEKSDILIET